MDSYTRVLRGAAVLPGAVLSIVVLLDVSALLPDPLGGLLLVADLVVMLLLAIGRLEPAGVRVLGRARALTSGEEQLLDPVRDQLRAHRCEVPALYVARSDGGRPAAEPCGRHGVVLAPRLLAWLQHRQVHADVLAAVLAQAAASLQAGPSRRDLAVRLLTSPGALLLAGFRRLAALFTWIPGLLGLWRIRAVFGAVAVWQCLGDALDAIALTTGLLVTVSYTSPACARAWRRRVEDAADKLVAKVGLGDELAFALRSDDQARSLERARQLRPTTQPAAAASGTNMPTIGSGAPAGAEAPTSSHDTDDHPATTGRHLHLVR